MILSLCLMAISRTWLRNWKILISLQVMFNTYSNFFIMAHLNADIHDAARFI
jgi:hypothetical protein